MFVQNVRKVLIKFMVVINLDSFFDTECKPLSKCQGFKPKDAKETQRLMNQFSKYSDINLFDSDPGEGNRMFKIRDGLKGGYEDRDKVDPVTNKKLRNLILVEM